jgi:hypothetical protein
VEKAFTYFIGKIWGKLYVFRVMEGIENPLVALFPGANRINQPDHLA